MIDNNKSNLIDKMKIYEIMDNDMLSLRALIYNPNSLTLLKSVYDSKRSNALRGKNVDEDFYHDTFPVLHIEKCEKIFIGENLDCRTSQIAKTTKEAFTGNSLLVQLKDKNYLCIHNGLALKFKSKSEIKSYFSPVGRNMVPYPYAIDLKNNYYVFMEDEIVTFDTKEWVKDPNYVEDFSSKEKLGAEYLDFPETFSRIIKFSF